MVLIQLPCRVNQSLREFRIDPSVSIFMCVGQCAAGHTVLNAHVSEFAGLCPKAGFDVA